MTLEIGLAEDESNETLEGTVLEASALLVTIEPESVNAIFTTPKGLDPLIAKIEQAVKAHVPDTSTAKGRKEIASFAHKVAKTKTYLDNHGKDLVATLKELPKLIDAHRKAMRERLEVLQDQARKPLDDWEAEQLRLDLEKQAREAEEVLAKEIAFTHEIGLLLNAEYDRVKEEKRKTEEQARKDLEERLKREAEEKARIEAQQALEQAQREKEEAEKRAREAEERREREQKEALEREERARVEALEREEKAKAEAAEREEQARIEAAQAERRRQEEQERNAREAQARREADIEHRRKVNGEALADLLKFGILNDTAKSVITAIATGQIRNISINY